MNEVTADVLKVIMQNVGADAEKIAVELTRISRIRRQKFDLQQERLRAKNEYEAALRVIKTAEDELRKVCPHYSTSYNADPAGGRGWTSCDHCGGEV